MVAYHQQLGNFHRLPFETATSLFRRSYLMVDLFFVLSGFIISYVYVADRAEKMRPSETKTFLFTRFARIYPLHLLSLLYLTLVTLGMLSLLAVTGHDFTPLTNRDAEDWLLQLFLLNAWVPGHESWNIPSWSISAEMVAYVLFPAIVAMHCRSPKAAALALLSLSIAFYAYVAATSGSLDIVAGLAPLRCIAGFGIGMLLYFHRPLAARASDLRLSALQWLALVAALAALMWRVNDPLIIPAFALIVWSTWPDRGMISAMLSTRLFQWLGEISYSVYLLHVPVNVTLLFFWSHLARRLAIGPDFARSIWLGLTFSVVLAASTLTYRYIEVPARRGLVQWSGRRKTPAADAFISAP